MTYVGRVLLSLVALSFAMLSAEATAKLSASVDRTEIAMGESLRLTIVGDDGEDPDDIDLRAIERQFDILSRSSSTRAQRINGQNAVTRTLELDLAPRSEGIATIPSLSADGRQSTPIAIKIKPMAQVAPGDERVLFSAQTSDSSVYVQQQIILTVTLQQSVQLENRAISDLQIDQAVVQPLEQRSYQRQAGGRLWQVTELRWAIFPERSGQLTIPAITFSAREVLPGRSLLGARLGSRVSLNTEAMTLSIKPVPANFKGATWLPATNLTLSETWSSDPSALNLGDSPTRTISVSAQGLQGSQLPTLNDLPGRQPTGLRLYPDLETTDQREANNGIVGERVQRDALVASEAGQWELPSIEIHWWNTETDQPEVARIAARRITISGSSVLETPSSQSIVTDQTAVTHLWIWQLAAISGWLLATALALYRRRPQPSSQQQHRQDQDIDPLLALRNACNDNDASRARVALLRWAQRTYGGKASHLDAVLPLVSPPLRDAIDMLNACLFSARPSPWQGADLLAAVQSEIAPTQRPNDSFRLYPSDRK